MKIKITGFGLGSLITVLLMAMALQNGRAQQAERASRQVITINSGWDFVYRDQEVEEPGAVARLEDDAWKRINLPHTWNADDAFDEEPGYDRGIGWYKKNLSLPSFDENRKYYLHFEGANQIADVYVNGRHVKRHVGGYTAFTADITDALEAGGDNQLLVRMDNRHNPDVPPLNADFTFYGGIYRDVELWSVPGLHFAVDTTYGSPGIKVETPEVSEKQGRATVTAGMTNSTDETFSGTVSAVLTTPGGSKVDMQQVNFNLDAESAQNLSFRFDVANPELWSPDNPALYKVALRLQDGGRVIDELQTSFGFRFFTFDPDRGFVLNGEAMTLRGTNRHQDLPGIGNALSDAQHRRDMELIKSMGVNYVRLAHYPQDPAVLEAADELGMVIWEETPIVNYITPNKAFEEHSKQMLKEMIRQHYNHPSVVLWGYMNEILLFNEEGNFGATDDSVYVRELRGLAKELDRVAHEEDPTRYTAMAMHYSGIYDKTGLAPIADVAGWNLYFGWYYEDFEDLGRFLDEQHEKYPDRVLTISEYGAGSDERVHAQRPQSFDFSNEYQNALHESYLSQIRERDYLAATAIWNQFDFGSESRGDTKPHVNQKGVMFYDRTPKDAFYHYQSQWANVPVLHINSPAWTKVAASSASLNDTLRIYSNLERVELQKNGELLGSRAPDDNGVINWPVSLGGGMNHFTATGHASDQLLVSERKIRLVPDNPNKSDESWNLNVGAPIQFIDQTEALWIPDSVEQTENWQWSGGKTGSISSEIQLTDREPIFHYFRTGMDRFETRLDSGRYSAELIFVEPEHREEGKRVFDVMVNGVEVAKRLDLARRAGHRTAYSLETEVEVGDDGQLNIAFKPYEGDAIISGIRIRRIQ